MSAEDRNSFYDQCVCNVLGLSDKTEIKQSVCEMMDTLAGECEQYDPVPVNWRPKCKCGTYNWSR